MADELQIWVLDESGEVTPLEQTNRTEYEEDLESALVKNPKMLMPNLELVGRQTPVAGGFLDLLGVDGDGRLVVFELKRGALTRDAVTQVIDYCSSLEAMADADLAQHIAERSGNLGIAHIEDFGEWYDQRFEKRQLGSLRPIRSVLVGLGADESAPRMVNYLRDQGVNIACMTFHGYQHNGHTLLARNMEKTSHDIDAHRSTDPTEDEKWDALCQYAATLGIERLWKEAEEALRPPARRYYWSAKMRHKGITFYPQFSLPLDELVSATKATTSHSVRMDPDGRIRVTFFPVAIELCYDEFKREAEKTPFQFEPPPNAAATRRAPEQWYCLLTADKWAAHKDVLVGLVEAVYQAWDKRLE